MVVDAIADLADKIFGVGEAAVVADAKVFELLAKGRGKYGVGRRNAVADKRCAGVRERVKAQETNE